MERCHWKFAENVLVLQSHVNQQYTHMRVHLAEEKLCDFGAHLEVNQKKLLFYLAIQYDMSGGLADTTTKVRSYSFI
jgi:hypothetical protein